MRTNPTDSNVAEVIAQNRYRNFYILQTWIEPEALVSPKAEFMPILEYERTHISQVKGIIKN
ncbi:MAG TPA: hypothetical protein V6C95_04050 [Coleofasciculaceae cyanobacterium]